MLTRLLTLFLVGACLPAATHTQGTAQPVETPLTLPGAETYIYHEVSPEPMRLHVFKPAGWTGADRRPAWIHFFGGGFVNGTPLQSAGYGRNAARLGLVGIAVDYRVKNRHGTDASQCVADARAALHWVQTHAAELGIDPARVIVSGSSAGGHLALWTAITHSPWGSDPAKTPPHKPAALILLSAASDTSEVTGQRANRFAGRGIELSPAQHLDEEMPPTLIFHGDADSTVPYRYSVALHDKLRATGNDCEFVTLPGGAHNLSTPEQRATIAARSKAFLQRLKLMP